MVRRGSGRPVEEGRLSQPPPSELLNAGRFLRRSVEESNVPFWTMELHDELAGGARARPCLCAMRRNGVYLTTGGRFTLDLSADAGPFTARWFNPREGKFSEAFQVEGGDKREFQAPDGSDGALLVRR